MSNKTFFHYKISWCQRRVQLKVSSLMGFRVKKNGVDKGLKDRIASKKEQQLEAMNAEQILNELKQKHLPTFGTGQERKDRLRKHLGK